jgi:hypothetical protein
METSPGAGVPGTRDFRVLGWRKGDTADADRFHTALLIIMVQEIVK